MNESEIKAHLESFLGANDEVKAITNVMFWTCLDQLGITPPDYDTHFQKAQYTRDHENQDDGRWLIYGDENHPNWIPHNPQIYPLFPRLCLELGFIAAAMEAQKWINLINNSKPS